MSRRGGADWLYVDRGGSTPPLSCIYLYVCGVRGAGYIKNPLMQFKTTALLVCRIRLNHMYQIELSHWWNICVCSDDNAYIKQKVVREPIACFSLSLTHARTPPSSHLSLPSIPLRVTAPCWIQRIKGSQGPECVTVTWEVTRRCLAAQQPDWAARWDIFEANYIRGLLAGLFLKERRNSNGNEGKRNHVRILLSWSIHCNVNYHGLRSGQKRDVLRTVCIAFSCLCTSGTNLVENGAFVYMGHCILVVFCEHSNKWPKSLPFIFI